MEKSKILLIGLGGAGNRQLDTILDLDKRYTGIYMNTNLSEMENLKHFDRDRRCFYIPNADGCGQDRNLSEQYIKEEAPKFVEIIKKFTNQNTIIMISSMDGGTGSKATTMLAKLTKKVCPDKSINLVLTVPSLNSSLISYNNTIDTWNEVIDLKNKGIVDSIMFIDNNQSISELEINNKAMKELDDGIGISENNTDTADSRRVHTSKGYKVILNLDDTVNNIDKAVDMAIGKSMFYIPDDLSCDVMVGSISENFNKKDIEKKFQPFDFSKINESASNNSILVIGGCSMPKEAIELIQEAKRDIENRKKSRVVEDINELKIRSSSNNKKNEKVDNTSSKVSSDELNAMFEDDSFWD